VSSYWLFFGFWHSDILGVHRFYTRTPKVGMLYFCTLGLCGLGWLLGTHFTCFTRSKVQMLTQKALALL
jgi:TM2 domain-containing membrane protein YozV